MLQQRNIAFFIDVDNMNMSCEHYFNVMQQLQRMGNILFGKVYGVGERKHKEIIADLDAKGFKAERAMRVKHRGKKEFDSRIFVDVVETVCNARTVDAVCIIAQPTDMVYLYGYLHAHGVKIVACDNGDVISASLVDEIVDLGMVETLVLPVKPPVKQKPASAKKIDNQVKLQEDIKATEQPVQEPVEQPTEPQAELPKTESRPMFEADKTDELLKKIESLRALSETKLFQEPKAEQIEEQPASEPKQPASELEQQPQEEVATVDEPVSEPEQPLSIAQELASFNQKVHEYNAPAEEPVQEQPQPEQPQQTETEQQPQEKVEQPEPKSEPRTSYVQQNDSDLIRKIEEIRRNSAEGDNSELLDQISKLLDLD